MKRTFRDEKHIVRKHNEIENNGSVTKCAR